MQNSAFVMNTDGGSRGNPGPAAIGFSISQNGQIVCEGGCLIGTSTNNCAEYKALIWGLRNALEMGIHDIEAIADSELMVNQVNGKYRVKDAELKNLHAEVQRLIRQFDSFGIVCVRRSENKRPDALVNQTLDANASVGNFCVPFYEEENSLFSMDQLEVTNVQATKTQPEEPAESAVSTGMLSDDERHQMVEKAISDLRQASESAGVEQVASLCTERAQPMQAEEQPAQTTQSTVDANVVAGKTILLGVTGCIAAYKSCEVLRLLQKAGANVKVVMTQNAEEFVGAATFRALTKQPVAVGLFDSPEDPIHHISLAKEASLILIAPCTANVLNKLAHGQADDLLTTTVLASKAKLVIAPAMNVQMWQNPKTQEAVKILREGGAVIVQPATGYLACGDEGEGKLAPVEQIAQTALDELSRAQSMAGKKVLITSGPTYEPIDPVRFIGNRSSGLTGTLMAQEAAARGAEVVLVSGPTSLKDPYGVTTVHVQTAQQMLEACQQQFDSCDAAIFCAAVADFRPAMPSNQKIKKQALDQGTSAFCLNDAGGFTLELVRNPDILSTMASVKDDRFIVGFAAETGDVVEYAQDKLESKNADLIVANDVSSSQLGFGTQNNRVWFVTHDGVSDSGVLSKAQIASMIIDKVEHGIALNGR